MADEFTFGQKAGQAGVGALSGGMAGAGTGATAGFLLGGPAGAAVGMGIGAGVGALGGVLGARQDWKAQEAEADAIAKQQRMLQKELNRGDPAYERMIQDVALSESKETEAAVSRAGSAGRRAGLNEAQTFALQQQAGGQAAEAGAAKLRQASLAAQELEHRRRQQVLAEFGGAQQLALMSQSTEPSNLQILGQAAGLGLTAMSTLGGGMAQGQQGGGEFTGIFGGRREGGGLFPGRATPTPSEIPTSGDQFWQTGGPLTGGVTDPSRYTLTAAPAPVPAAAPAPVPAAAPSAATAAPSAPPEAPPAATAPVRTAPEAAPAEADTAPAKGGMAPTLYNWRDPSSYGGLPTGGFSGLPDGVVPAVPSGEVAAVPEGEVAAPTGATEDGASSLLSPSEQRAAEAGVDFFDTPPAAAHREGIVSAEGALKVQAALDGDEAATDELLAELEAHAASAALPSELAESPEVGTGFRFDQASAAAARAAEPGPALAAPASYEVETPEMKDLLDRAAQLEMNGDSAGATALRILANMAQPGVIDTEMQSIMGGQ